MTLFLPCLDATLTVPWPYLDLSLTLPWLCLDLALMTFHWPCLDISLSCPDLTLTLPWPFHDLALNLPWTCLDFALMVKIGLVTAEILMIRTNVARKYVAWSNVILTVGIYLRWYKELKPLKFGQNWISNSWNIPDMDKSHLDKCCLDKCPRNLPLKFHKNQVSNSWDIANIEFLWWGHIQSHFHV